MALGSTQQLTEMSTSAELTTLLLSCAGCLEILGENLEILGGNLEILGA